MTIEPGTNLLHYRLVGEIGSGGMGSVWRAVDTSLNREVAIKILPEVFFGDAERLVRFEREARLLASLNHPNIAAIYGFHEVEGRCFLAMELVEGEDLAKRCARGGVPRAEALRIALEVARGLEAAHDKGIVHRDLKPANVLLARDGTIKVFDFGLAKALAPDTTAEGTSPSMSPTLTSAGTVAGLILGTAAYMSPEQAKGKPVDRRADIWSFGVVLYELFSGRRLFDAETVSETLAAVLMKEPDWAALPADTPGSVRRLLQRSLQREPRSRLRDIGDARIVLEEALSAPGEVDAPARRPLTRALPWLVAAAALLALFTLALRPAAKNESANVMRLELAVPEEIREALQPIPMLALSRDGRRLVFVGRGADASLLYLRALDQPNAVALPGTEDAENPIFSPDGKWIAFAQDGKLKRMSVAGGPPATLCDAPLLRGASWGHDGTIVFAPERTTGLMRIPEAGGAPEPLTTFERGTAAAIQPSHRWPEILPDGRTVLFTATENDSDYTEARIVALSLADKKQKTVIEGGTFPRYVPAGFLVFVRGDAIYAARFDPVRVELLGPAVPVLEGVAVAPLYGSAQLTFSESGTLACLEAFGGGGGETLVWVDRDGKETPASVRRGSFASPALSPDGSLVAMEVLEKGPTNIWVLELARDTLSRLTFDSPVDGDPVWSPDGDWIVYDSMRESASRNLYRQRANGTGEAERLTTSPRHQIPFSWSPDGKVVAFVETEGPTQTDIMLLHLEDPPRSEVFLKTPFREGFPEISPDGRFIAYASNETGASEIYVLPLGRPGGRTQISTGGGFWPRFAPDGSEIFYAGPDGGLMSASVSLAGSTLRPSLPRKVIDFPDGEGGPFAVAPDGRRFLVFGPDGANGAAQSVPSMIVNWFAELEEKVPLVR